MLVRRPCRVALSAVARRLEIELTSQRDDGTWTWRASGAREPRGAVGSDLIPGGSSVGDVFKVEADASLDGLEIVTVFATKGPRAEPELLELLGSGGDDPLVTTQLASKRGRRRDDDGDDRKRPRGREERNRREGRGKDDRKPRDGSQRRGRPQKEREKPPSRPRAKRLRPRRAHRQEALKALPEDQRVLADQVLHDGVPGVRQAIAHMNDLAKAEGLPTVNADPLVELAERLAPSLKAAEWHDRADAALAGIREIDLRDIRSVIVAADTAAKTDETRELAESLRSGLAARLEAEHRKWLDELAANIGEGRAVRALRLSSRPPKPGSPLPPDMAERLASLASSGLDADTPHDRWATVVEAVAFSPVREQVVPPTVPATPSDELLSAVRKVADRVPQIASLFGIQPAPPTKRRGRNRRTPPPPPPVDVPTEVVDAAVDVPTEVVDAAVDVPTEVVDAAVDVPTEVVDAAVDVPTEVVDAAVDVPTEVVDAAVDVPTEVVDAAVDVPTEVVDAAVDVPTEVVDAAVDVPTEVVDAPVEAVKVPNDVPVEVVEAAVDSVEVRE